MELETFENLYGHEFLQIFICSVILFNLFITTDKYHEQQRPTRQRIGRPLERSQMDHVEAIDVISFARAGTNIPPANRRNIRSRTRVVSLDDIACFRFFTGFALFRQECRRSQMNEVRIDFFYRLGSTCTNKNLKRKYCL